MDTVTADLLISLTEIMCVIIVAAYVLTRTKMFSESLGGKIPWKSQMILMLVFGLLSIFGTYAGIDIMGVKVNVRDLGPMIAGLVGGPFMGIGAGLIGGIHRLLFVGGETTLSCSLATIFAGIFGSIIWFLAGKRFPGVLVAVAFAIMQEVFHMALVILLVTPYDYAVKVVEQVGPPMIVVNALGMLLFAYIINNLVKERRTQEERDRLHDAIEKEKFEMEVARDIQQSFLPKNGPSVERYDVHALNLSAKEVGGDFYDFIDLGGERSGLVIADVSGKGVPGAIYMALSRTVLRATSLKAPGPSAALAEANRLIAETSESSGMFVTLFYAVLDRSARKLTYSNAGHNPPLLLRLDAFTELSGEGIALGAMEGAVPEERELQLQEGDLVLFYTDGVTEANAPSGELYGEDRLKLAIRRLGSSSATDIVEGIKDDVLEFSKGVVQYDDITLMALKVGVRA
jgi:sigma-B regulation protein RsbU (phosphoserine phosphatase)